MLNSEKQDLEQLLVALEGSYASSFAPSQRVG